ncbi:hypothetical protein QEZ54_22220 [Catellatospora sp. KI3]|uniref:DUF7617 domain-containing protein n=1 Tax=Catellatospora sp. KI3 TaxID=3041620 RepID=UPI0024822591|nr:hypothetical protein [Catellatospora sp. KI3]MDI1463703.1 hypothetical protein [Catellatospora sp. KI3]
MRRSPRLRHWPYAAALLALSLALSLALAPAGPAAGVPTAQAAGSLTKSAQNVTHPGADPASHGDLLNWTVSYADGGTGGPVTVTDPISSGHGYVNGSLRVPPDWTRQWSTDGTTFGNTEPAAGTVAVRATIPALNPGGTSLTRILLPPVRVITSPTGGDGFTPVLYRSDSGAVEAWNTYHHLGAASPKVVCTDLLTAQPCAGGPWPRPLNTTPGPLGSGNTGDIASGMAPQFVFDPERAGTLYYPAITAASIGVGCLDLDARANCGFFPLIGYGAAPEAYSVGGFVEHGGNLYGVASTGAVLCLTMATQAPCAGQPYAAILPDRPNGNFFGSLTLVGDKLFASSSQSGPAPTLGCFDPATATACDGWAAYRTFGNTSMYTYGVFTSYTTSGQPDGACIPMVSSPYQVFCAATDGSALAAPNLGALPAGALTFRPETITAPDGHLRSYLPLWGGGLPGSTGCYDWTTAAVCTGMPFPNNHPAVNNGVTRDYGYDYDEVTQCLIGLGDAGMLFSEDPITGASPCFHAGASITLATPDFYCDGGTDHVKNYQNARLDDIALANVDLANSSATISTPDGTVIDTVGFAADGTVDLSGISTTTYPKIVVDAALRLNNVDDFGNGNEPHLIAGFIGDPPQVCFQTTVNSACTVTNVDNTAIGTDTAGALTSNTVKIGVAAGAACSPHVSIEKEICRDSRATRCGPGGVGPWGKTSPAGLLGILGTAYWRITVSNAGPVSAETVTVNDPVTPGCAAAAGTFKLAAGESKQIYCSSFLLLLPLTNTATASYLAPNAPPGTPKSVTSPSSATACSLLCILAGPDQVTVYGSKQLP